MDHSPLHTRLKHLNCLSEEDLSLLTNLFEKTHLYSANDSILAEGATLDKAEVITDGWALRYKTLADGRRQILNFLLPGDVYGVFCPLFEEAEYGVEALTRVTSYSFKAIKILETFAECPQLWLALCWLAGVDERQLDEQIMRVGKRNAAERMAHLFLELRKRQLRSGIKKPQAQQLPISQSILADALGMSHVHTNRSFGRLVRNGMVKLNNREISLVDIDALKTLAQFDGGYLLDTEVPEDTKNAINTLRDSNET